MARTYSFLLSRNFHVRTPANFYARWAMFNFFFYAWPSICCLYFIYARIKRQWKSTCNTFLCILGFLFKVSFSSRFTLFTSVDLVYHPPQNVALPLSAVIPRRSWNLKLFIKAHVKDKCAKTFVSDCSYIIEKGPTRSYRLGLSLSYLISITDIADCGWPRREYNYYNGHLFKQGRHSLSKGSRWRKVRLYCPVI